MLKLIGVSSPPTESNAPPRTGAVSLAGYTGRCSYPRPRTRLSAAERIKHPPRGRIVPRLVPLGSPYFAEAGILSLNVVLCWKSCSCAKVPKGDRQAAKLGKRVAPQGTKMHPGRCQTPTLGESQQCPSALWCNPNAVAN